MKKLLFIINFLFLFGANAQEKWTEESAKLSQEQLNKEYATVGESP
ncbi:hypothetical protein [Flavobacterium sp.]